MNTNLEITIKELILSIRDLEIQSQNLAEEYSHLSWRLENFQKILTKEND